MARLNRLQLYRYIHVAINHNVNDRSQGIFIVNIRLIIPPSVGIEETSRIMSIRLCLSGYVDIYCMMLLHNTYEIHADNKL